MAAIFLDLDGTLVDSKPGIVTSLKHAFKTNGLASHAQGDLTWMIGPPFADSFARLGIADHAPVLQSYRAHYQAEGMFIATVYSGVIDALSAFAAHGHRLFLMTAKPHAYARKITAHFGLAPFMEAEYGPELDGTRGHKAELLAYALAETGILARDAVMIGDRSHDFDAVRANGLPSISVDWGYGSADELAQADVRLNGSDTMRDGVLAFLDARR